MPGNGDRPSGGIAVTVDGTNLPSLLTRLEAEDPTVRREAVETVRDAIDDEPASCLPTVPKLRGVLERDSPECRDTAAYCLAELAEEFPDDVAPSVGTIARFAREAATTAGRRQALRCLAHVALVRESAVVPYCETVRDVLEDDPGDDGILKWGMACLSELAVAEPDALEVPETALEAALEDGRVAVRRNACLVVGHGRLSSVVDHLESVAVEESNPEVQNRAVWAIERARGESPGSEREK